MMDEGTMKELDALQSDLISLEGALCMMRECAFSPDHCKIGPLVWMGNSLELTIEFVSKRSETLEELLKREHINRSAKSACSCEAGGEAGHE
ncbi:MAG: hypothetical protein LIO81_02335 [Clostridiales bacterium]|nr:hypothetical protein [Clostridiales bacterium]